MGFSALKLGLLAMLVLLASAGVYVLLFLDMSVGPDAPSASYEPLIFPEEAAPAAVPAAPALTHDASELRRVAAEHSRLLTSLPPPPAPTATRVPEVLREAVVSLVGANLGGVPLSTPELSGWFDPAAGLEFYREEGGDWTLRDLRETHPYRELFYYDSYPEGVRNFHDGSIHRPLARRLASEAVEVLPALGPVTDAMVSAFSRRLGWAVRDVPEPAISLWTTFTVYDRDAASRYAVGGVMVLGSRVWTGDGGDASLEFLVPGEFVGPVVVQRVSTEAVSR